MTTICLVACASKKRSAPAPAKDLYLSTLFEKSRAYAQIKSDNWFILSAKYGLLSPDALAEPYDLTLNRMGKTERREWAHNVEIGLRKLVKDGDRVIFLAGQRYRKDLTLALGKMGAKVEVPMEGLRIGEQLSWLSKHA